MAQILLDNNFIIAQECLLKVNEYCLKPILTQFHTLSTDFLNLSQIKTNLR
jgi:hypothetical protein